MNTISCNCGTMVNEDPSLQMLKCSSCGNEFTTPEHDQRFRDYMQGALQINNHDNNTSEQKPKKNLLIKFFGWIAGIFIGITGRILFLIFGLLICFLTFPLLFRYGFLKNFSDTINHFYLKLPIIGSFYNELFILADQLYFQILLSIIIGIGIALIRKNIKRK